MLFQFFLGHFREALLQLHLMSATDTLYPAAHILRRQTWRIVDKQRLAFEFGYRGRQLGPILLRQRPVTQLTRINATDG